MAESDYDRIQRILMENKDVPMVQRILNPKQYPVLDMGVDEQGNPKWATHLMSWGSGDGRYYVYPNVVHNNGEMELIEDGEKAFKRAIKNRNAIVFDNKEDAKWFSKTYKKYWEPMTDWPPNGR